MSAVEITPYTIAHFRDVSSDALLTRSGGRKLQAALIFTPDACLVAQLEGTTFESLTRNGKAVPDLSRAYEIRAFGPDAELRWIRQGANGSATLLADGEIAPPDGAEISTGTTLDVLRRQYRLWSLPAKPGETGASSANLPAGWAALSNGRIDTIYIPLPDARDASKEVALLAREYVVRGAEGNAVVLFERLSGFALVAD